VELTEIDYEHGEADETDSGCYSVVGLGISGAKSLDCFLRELVILLFEIK
jgi:hypothetical protein